MNEYKDTMKDTERNYQFIHNKNEDLLVELDEFKSVTKELKENNPASSEKQEIKKQEHLTCIACYIRLNKIRQKYGEAQDKNQQKDITALYSLSAN